MEHFKLNYRNLSAGDQIELCERTVRAIANLAEEKRKHVDLPDTQARVAAARASHDRIAKLRAELKAEVASRKTLLGDMRHGIRSACKMATYLAESRPLAFAEIGLPTAMGRKLPVGTPAAPTGLRADSPEDGCARLRWKRPVRRCSFEVQMTDNPSDDAGWKHCLSTSVQSCIVHDMASGAKLWFRVCAINAQGYGPWSQPVSVRVK